MVNELCCETCLTWDNPRDRKSWLQFCKMLSGNLDFQLGGRECSELLNSIAFCNYLQIPDFNLEDRQGKDKEELYLHSKTVFKEYLEAAIPDKILVWGKIAYSYISDLGKRIDDRHCKITTSSGKEIDVMKINHPCRIGVGGYSVTTQQIEDFLKE